MASAKGLVQRGFVDSDPFLKSRLIDRREGIFVVWPASVGAALAANNTVVTALGLQPVNRLLDTWHLEPIQLPREGGTITNVKVLYEGNDGVVDTADQVHVGLWDANLNLLYHAVAARTPGFNGVQHIPVDWGNVPGSAFLGIAHSKAATGASAEASVVLALPGAIAPALGGYLLAPVIAYAPGVLQANTIFIDPPPDARRGNKFRPTSTIVLPIAMAVNWKE